MLHRDVSGLCNAISLYGQQRAFQGDPIRRIFLIVMSSWFAMIGKKYLPENASVVEAIKNIMILISGGVGGNFIYA